MEGIVAGGCQIVQTAKPAQKPIASNLADADDLVEP